MADRTLHISLTLSALMIAGALAGCFGPESTADLGHLVGGGKQVARGATAAFPIAVNTSGFATASGEDGNPTNQLTVAASFENNLGDDAWISTNVFHGLAERGNACWNPSSFTRGWVDEFRLRSGEKREQTCTINYPEDGTIEAGFGWYACPPGDLCEEEAEWVRSPLNLEGAARVTFDITVTEGGDIVGELTRSTGRSQEGTPLEVSVHDAAGLDVEHPPTILAPLNGSTALYVDVTVPADADTGDRTVRVEVSGDPGRDFVEIPVRVVEPSDRVTSNQTVQIDYVLRHPNGTIIATSIEAIANSSLPKDPIYQPPRRFGAINVSTGSGAPFVGLAEGLLDAGVNSSLSFGVPAWKAPWGNETVEGEQPRQTTVNRTSTFPQNLSRQRRFVQPVNDSSEVGDIVTLGAADVPFEITFLDNTTVNLTLAMSVGDRTTMDLLRDQRGVQNPWPNSSELTEFDNGTARFYTTPPENASEPFTFFEAFENASTIASIDEHEITIEHSPEVGLEYEWSSRRGTQTRTVTEVTESSIVFERENRHPLAGHRTVFDIAVLDAFDTQPPQAP